MMIKNDRGRLELETIIVIVLLFLTLLLVILWLSGGFKYLSGGISNIGNASYAKALNASNNYPG